MKKILILGTGCPKCEKLQKDVEAVVSELGVEAEIDKITDIQQMMQYGVMATPALVIDGEVKAAGKAPSTGELKKMLA